MCGASVSSGASVPLTENDKRVRPQGCFNVSEDVFAKAKQLVLLGRIAPFGEGVDTSLDPRYSFYGYDECPICCLEHPALNRTECCGKGICSDCFFKVKTSRLDPYQEERNESAKKLRHLLGAHCPFCKCKPFEVRYRGHKTPEERQRELEEEQKVSLALCKKRENDNSTSTNTNMNMGNTHGQHAQSREEETFLPIVTGASTAPAASSPIAGPRLATQASTASTATNVAGDSNRIGSCNTACACPYACGSADPEFVPQFLLGGGGPGGQQAEVERLRRNQIRLEQIQIQTSSPTSSRSPTVRRKSEFVCDSPVADNGEDGFAMNMRILSPSGGSFDLMNPFANKKYNVA